MSTALLPRLPRPPAPPAKSRPTCAGPGGEGFDEQLSRSGFLRRTVSFVLLGLGASGAVRTVDARRRDRPAAPTPTHSRPQRRPGLRRGQGALCDDQPAQRRRPTHSHVRRFVRPRPRRRVRGDKQTPAAQTVHDRTALRLPRGTSDIPWTPAPSMKPGTYILRLRQRAIRPARARLGRRPRARRRGDLPASAARSPGETVILSVQTDAPWLRLTLLRCGPEEGRRTATTRWRGAGREPQRIDLRRAGARSAGPVTVD